jgi:hypothetical protein
MKIGVTYDKAHRAVASGEFMYHFINQETFFKYNNYHQVG